MQFSARYHLEHKKDNSLIHILTDRATPRQTATVQPLNRPVRYPLSVGQQFVNPLTQGRCCPLLTVDCPLYQFLGYLQLVSFYKLNIQHCKINQRFCILIILPPSLYTYC